jgi:hypothetical protein
VHKPCDFLHGAVAAKTRLKQAAPGNDPAFGFYPGFLLAKATDSSFADEPRRAWVTPGSRLFKTCFGGYRAVKKIARFMRHMQKRLPSRAVVPFYMVGQQTVFEGRG